jgi:hypothetical protein
MPAPETAICAVVGLSAGDLEAAVAAQTSPPERVVTGPGGLRTLVERALDTGPQWLWLLDGSSVPRPGALAALREALERLDDLPDPAVLGGVLLTPEGGVDEARSLWYRPNQLDVAMVSVGRRLLPICASSGPALVRARSAQAQLPSRRARLEPGALIEWTARLLRFATGYLVPDSEAEAKRSGHDPVHEPRVVARLLLGTAFGWFDRVRLAYELAQRLRPASFER